MSEPDLNLLRVFDALFQLRSVTRAANQLGLTQSAVSHALGRLRIALGDPLFLRGPGGLQPTVRAVEIAPAVRESLAVLRAAFEPPGFNPAQSTRRFSIAGGGYFCTQILPPLVERLRLEAPATSIRVLPVTETLTAALDTGTLDLALIGTPARVPARFEREEILREDLVWIVSATSPISQSPFEPSRIAAMPKVVLAVTLALEVPLSREGPLGSQLFQAFDSETDSRDSIATVYDTLTAIDIVTRTDSVAMVPRRVAERAANDGRISIVSEPVAGFGLSMLWHRKQVTDAGLAWLRATIRAITT